MTLDLERAPVRTAGVYLITCLANAKVYIGSSKDLRNRFCQHRSNLRKGTHQNKPLQNAWNKYGEAEFDFGILQFCPPDLVSLYRLEQWHLDSFKPWDKTVGFNIAPFAGSNRGIDANKRLKKTFTIVSPSGEVHTATGIGDFAKKHGLHRCNLAQTLLGNLPHASGWHLPDKKPNNVYLRSAKEGYQFINPEGKLTHIPSEEMNALCDRLGLDRNLMIRVWRKMRDSHKGWAHPDRTDLYTEVIHKDGRRITVCKLNQGRDKNVGITSKAVSDLVSGRILCTEEWRLASTPPPEECHFIDPQGNHFFVPRSQLPAFSSKKGLKSAGMGCLWNGIIQYHRGWHRFDTAPKTIKVVVERKGCNKNVSIASPDGVVHHAASLTEFAQTHGFCLTSVSKLVRGEVKHLNGWSLPETYGPFKMPTKNSEEHRFLNPRGELVIVPENGLCRFCKKNQLKYSSMRAVWLGKIDFHKGWCSHSRPDMYVQLANSDGRSITICKRSRGEFARSENMNDGCVSMLLSGKIRQSHGWRLAA